MQYCMALPRHYLQGGAHYTNLTSIRVSGDRFEKRKWKEFLYGSRLASALGIWPWCDVFMSSETPNILLATLSAGVVGIGDSADSENLQNIFRAVRSDGMIVKPDAPIIPVDRSYSDDLDGRGVRIAMTHTDWGTLLKTVYMFAYADSAVHDEVRVKAPEAGIDGKAYVYDYFSGTGAEIDSVTPFRILGGSEPWSYHIVAPITKSGVAFIGDTGKFVTCGKARIAKLVEIAGGIRGTVLLARGEGMVTLCGYSPRVVDIQAEGGTMSDRTYDSSAHLFRFGFRAKENLRYRMRDGEDVAEIQVTIRVR